MAWVRSLAYMLVFYGLSVPIVVFGLTLVRRPHRMIGYAIMWGRFHDWCVRNLLNIRVSVDGVVPTRGVVVACKHQSAWETLAMLAMLDGPIIVLKRELTLIPVWGRLALSFGAIPVDREGSSSALRAMMRAADTARASGRAVLIFPEGTRVMPGEQPELRAGLAGLYRRLDLPVVPVALDAGRLWPRRSLLKRAGTIHLRVGEAIPPGLPRAEMEARVLAGINAFERS